MHKLLMYFIHIIHLYLSIFNSVAHGFIKSEGEDFLTTNSIVVMAPPPIIRMRKITQPIEQMPNCVENRQINIDEWHENYRENEQNYTNKKINQITIEQNLTKIQEKCVEMTPNPDEILQNPNDKKGKQDYGSTSSKSKPDKAVETDDIVVDSDSEEDDPDQNRTEQNSRPSISTARKDLFLINRSKLFARYQKYKNKHRKMNEKQIAKKLKISTSTLHQLKKWKGIPMQSKSNEQQREQKRQIIEKYNEMKQNNPNLTDGKIAEKLEITPKRLCYLKRCERLINYYMPRAYKKYNPEEKSAILEQYNQLKIENPDLTELEICAILNVPQNTIKYWKKG